MVQLYVSMFDMLSLDSFKPWCLMGLMGVSPGSLFLIAFVALLVFGPKRLKTIGVELAGVIKQLKKALDDGEDKA